MNVKKAISATLLALILGACAANGNDRTAAATASPVMTSQSLIASIERAGLEARDAGMVEQPFFAVPAHVYVVEEGDLQVYTFATTADAENAASQVASNGMTIGTSSMHWMAPPHFFRRDRLIVNYLGSSEKALASLRELLGPQFAGQ